VKRENEERGPEEKLKYIRVERANEERGSGKLKQIKEQRENEGRGR
jgi:hypothetical protein